MPRPAFLLFMLLTFLESGQALQAAEDAPVNPAPVNLAPAAQGEDNDGDDDGEIAQPEPAQVNAPQGAGAVRTIQYRGAEYPEDPFSANQAQGYVKAGRLFSNSMYWGYVNVKTFMLDVLQQAAGQVALGLVDIVMKPLKKTINVKFNIWFKKTFPPTEFQLAKRADKNGQRVRELLFNEKVSIKIDSFLDQLNEASRNNEPLPSLLLYGPPGTGKTEIAKRLANEGDYEVLIFSASELKSSSMYMGEKDDTLLHIFNYASRKRQANVFSRTIGRVFSSAAEVKEKIVIFIDEGEEILTPSDGFERSPELQAFLTATGTRSPHFTVVLTTNFIAKIDEAAYRRFSYRIEVDNPDSGTRLKIIRSYLQKYQTRYKDAKLETAFLNDELALAEFIKASEGLAGRELERIAQSVAVAANASPSKSVTKELLLQYIDDEQEDQRRLVREREKEEEKRRNLKRERQRDAYAANMELKGGLPNRDDEPQNRPRGTLAPTP